MFICLVEGMHVLVFAIWDERFKYPENFTFLPKSKEIYQFYQHMGMSVLDYNESDSMLCKKDEKGLPIRGRFAYLVAKKA